MARERELTQKEPVALFWIIIGSILMIASMIGIERMIPRY
jgi:hypothetical protein